MTILYSWSNSKKFHTRKSKCPRRGFVFTGYLCSNDLRGAARKIGRRGAGKSVMRIRWRSIWKFCLPAIAGLFAGCAHFSPPPPSVIAAGAFIRPGAPTSTRPKAPSQTRPSRIPARPVRSSAGPAALPGNIAKGDSTLALAALSPPAPVIRAAPAPLPGKPLTVAALLGTVNGRPLFVQDILHPLAAELRNQAATSRTQSYFREQAMTSIARQLQIKIDNMLLLQAARQQLSKDQKKEIVVLTAQKKAKLIAQYLGSAEVANRALERQGSSLARKTRQIREKLTIRVYISRLIAPSLVVTRRQIWNYYQSHRSHFTSHARISLYTITYPVIRQWPRDPHDPTHTRPIRHPTPAQLLQAQRQAIAYCRKLEDRIRHGANFAFLAEDNSVDYHARNGGHWPNVRRGELTNPQIEKVAFALRPHSMAPPLLIVNKKNPRRDVVVIIRVTRVWPHKVIPFAVAQKRIATKLRDREFHRLMNRYYQRLYNQASIAARERMLATATDAAVALYYDK